LPDKERLEKTDNRGVRGENKKKVPFSRRPDVGTCYSGSLPDDSLWNKKKDSGRELGKNKPSFPGGKKVKSPGNEIRSKKIDGQRKVNSLNGRSIVWSEGGD